ncbi:hypothetical protein DFJ74DRAFT_145227 [Hyaloraphidium curvatum]|nr:hypothetical protein DFJ74DRAFT_145227 [Hyaloraphidium curvatum]
MTRLRLAVVFAFCLAILAAVLPSVSAMSDDCRACLSEAPKNCESVRSAVISRVRAKKNVRFLVASMGFGTQLSPGLRSTSAPFVLEQASSASLESELTLYFPGSACSDVEASRDLSTSRPTTPPPASRPIQAMQIGPRWSATRTCEASSARRWPDAPAVPLLPRLPRRRRLRLPKIRKKIRKIRKIRRGCEPSGCCPPLTAFSVTALVLQYGRSRRVMPFALCVISLALYVSASGCCSIGLML